MEDNGVILKVCKIHGGLTKSQTYLWAKNSGKQHLRCRKCLKSFGQSNIHRKKHQFNFNGMEKIMKEEKDKIKKFILEKNRK